MARPWLACALLLAAAPARAADEARTGAAFLEIPVGGRAGALGGAAGALAGGAYGPAWNPAGLARAAYPEFASMHLSWLQGIAYEYVGLAAPLGRGWALGGALQYLHTGALAGIDASGAPTGDFAARCAAYSAGLAWASPERFALGVSARAVTLAMDGSAGSAWTGDAGLLWKPGPRITLGAAFTPRGRTLKLEAQEDPLPAGTRTAAAWQVSKELLATFEQRWPQYGPASSHAGLEWRPRSGPAALRAGWRSDVASELAPSAVPAGLSAGLGLSLWDQEFDYAFVPFGDLGQAQYFSLTLRFGRSGPPRLRRGPQPDAW